MANEIQVLEPEGNGGGSGAAGGGKRGAAGGGGAARSRLASALGLHLLAAPFRPLTRAWGKAQQGLPDAERKKRLIALAERAITRGVGSTWVVARAAELARPMLTVASSPLLDALAYGHAHASSSAAADAALAALLSLAQLAAALNLDDVCERCVGVLAEAAGVAAPAPHGSMGEAKQAR